MIHQEYTPHQFEVLGVVQRLAGEYRDSCPFCTADQLSELISWLRWRLTGGWEPTHGDLMRQYDLAVWHLALEVLKLWDPRGAEYVLAWRIGESANRVFRDHKDLFAALAKEEP